MIAPGGSGHEDLLGARILCPIREPTSQEL